MNDEYEIDFDEWIKPFGSVAKYLDEKFSDLLSKVLHQIRGAFVEESYRDKSSDESRKDFIAKIHAEWKKAERLISFQIYIYLDEVEALEKEKIKFHIEKNKEKKTACISEITKRRVRVRILRRYYDALVWAFLRGDNSSIRRFSTPKPIDNLSKKNIEDCAGFLAEANKDDLNIAINADITTFIHSGDALVFNPFKGLMIVEIKSGEKNIKICDDVEKYTRPEFLPLMENYVAKLNKNDRDQFLRIKDQLERSRSIVDILNNGSGVDHSTGQMVSIPTVNVANEYYSERVVSLYNVVGADKTWAIDVVDECLYIGVYSEHKSAVLGFNGWMKVLGCESPIINILDYLKDSLAPPLPYLDLPIELIEGVMRDKIVVAMCLDIIKFIECANRKCGDKFFLMSKKESRKYLDGRNEPLTYKSQVVGYKSGDRVGIVGYGLVTRILYDFQRPSNVVEQFIALP